MSYLRSAFPRWLLVALLVATLAKLWLVGGQTLFAIGYAGHDDRLFLRLAKNILVNAWQVFHGEQSGPWLGPYDNLTLAKGPFYPLWIAASFALSVPLLLAQHLLYIGACALVVVALRPLLRFPVVLALLYLLLLFNPISYSDWVMARVERAGIYPALTLFVLAGAAALAARYGSAPRSQVPWAVGFGMALPAFWLTREEGVWLLPVVLLPFAMLGLNLWRTRSGALREMVVLGVPFAMWFCGVFGVALLNRLDYGVFATVEFKSPEFLAAYGALTRVRPAQWHPMIPVPREVQARIDEVSPAFSELKPFLDGPMGKQWSAEGRDILGAAADGGEIAGGWFMWALRDASAAAGHHASGHAAKVYYARLASEVNVACQARRLDCGPERATMMPPWHWEYLTPLLETLAGGTLALIRFDQFRADTRPSLGSEESLTLFRDLTRTRIKVGTPDPLVAQSKMDQVRVGALEHIGRGYQRLALPVVVSALLAYLGVSVLMIWKREFSVLWLVNTAVLTAVVGRLGMLAFIEVSSFPTTSTHYFSPMYPLMLVFSVLALWDFVARLATPGIHRPPTTPGARTASG